jgi:hypothetical protein
MNKKISDTLNTILCYLEKLKQPVVTYMNAALDRESIINLFKVVSLNPSDELIELYQWRNGTKVIQGTALDDVQFFPGFHFLSLEDSISNYLAIQTDQRWNNNWFPIFANGGGDFYAIELFSVNEGNTPVIGFILGESQQDIEYQNLSIMLLTLCESYKRKIIFKDKEGYLEMDDEAYEKVALECNSNIPF